MLGHGRGDVNRQGKYGFPQSGPLPAALIRKRSEPECPYRGILRLGLQRVPAIGKVGKTCHNLGRQRGKVGKPCHNLGLGLHLFHGLMEDVDIVLESFLELAAEARQACS